MSKTTKRLSAVVALLLSLCLVFALFGFVGCGGDGDEDEEDEPVEFPLEAESFYASTTFGVAFIVGASFTMSNVNVYVVLDSEAEDGAVCIAGMRAGGVYDDTVVMLDSTGKTVDSLEITSDEMEITLQYTGDKYIVDDSAKTFTFTLSANYAESVAVYPYSLGMGGAIDSYAKVGEGASAMCVAAYYTAYSSWSGTEETSYDTHADCTITVNGSEDGVLAVGANTISATTVCKEAKTVTDEETGEESVVAGDALKINDIIVTICENTDGTYTYIVSGIGYDGEAYYTLDKDGKVTDTKAPDNWPSNWSEYRFEATKGDSSEDSKGNAYYLWIFSDGTLMFGTESDYNNLKTAGQTGGATGYWGYDNDTLKFVKTSAGYDATAGGLVYTNAYCTSTESGNSVTVTTPDSSPYVATITDIGCLAGATGYNLSELTIS